VRRALAVAILLAAAPAAAGDLIRFRAADGSVGMVDHPGKLPPGAVVLDVAEKTKTAPSSDAGDAPPAPNLRRSFGRPRAAPPPARPARGEADEYEARNDRQEATEVEWCARGQSARYAIEDAEARLSAAEDAYDRCDDGAIANRCSRSGIDSAERAIARAEENLRRLEEECRTGGCDPGWIRCR
jgi:hypothetical protein